MHNIRIISFECSRLYLFKTFRLRRFKLFSINHMISIWIIGFTGMVRYVVDTSILVLKVVKIQDFPVREVRLAIHFLRCIKIPIRAIIWVAMRRRVQVHRKMVSIIKRRYWSLDSAPTFYTANINQTDASLSPSVLLKSIVATNNEELIIAKKMVHFMREVKTNYLKKAHKQRHYLLASLAVAIFARYLIFKCCVSKVFNQNKTFQHKKKHTHTQQQLTDNNNINIYNFIFYFCGRLFFHIILSVWLCAAHLLLHSFKHRFYSPF